MLILKNIRVQDGCVHAVYCPEGNNDGCTVIIVEIETQKLITNHPYGDVYASQAYACIVRMLETNEPLPKEKKCYWY